MDDIVQSSIADAYTFFRKISNNKKRAIIASRSAGLGDMLVSTSHAWLFAEQNQRDLVIFWSDCIYLRNKESNGFNHFYEVPGKIGNVSVYTPESINSIVFWFLKADRLVLTVALKSRLLFKLVFRALRAFPSIVFSSRIQHRRERKMRKMVDFGQATKDKIIVLDSWFNSNTDESSVFLKHLKLKSPYLQLVNEYSANYFRDKVVIGVHARYYNQKMGNYHFGESWSEEDNALKNLCQLIDKATIAIGKSDFVIFVATDSEKTTSYILNKYEHSVSYSKQFGSDDSKELHEELPVETAEATIVEMHLLAKSNILVRFPKKGSWFSHYASLFADTLITEI